MLAKLSTGAYIESQQRGRPPIPSGLHRASRYPFAASIELTDVRSERLLTARSTHHEPEPVWMLRAHHRPVPGGDEGLAEDYPRRHKPRGLRQGGPFQAELWDGGRLHHN